MTGSGPNEIRQISKCYNFLTLADRPLVIIIIRVVVVVQLGLYIEDIWMKLGRYMGHGPNSSYRDG